MMTSYLESGISIQELREKRKLKVEKYIALGLGLYCFLIANIIISLTIIFFFGPQISVIFNGPPEITNVRKSSPPFPIPISITTPKATVTSKVTTSISPVTISFTTSPSIVITDAVTSKTENILSHSLTSTPIPEVNYEGFNFVLPDDGSNLYKFAIGCDFNGYNYEEYTDVPFDLCGEKCASDLKCDRFSWEYGNCFLKKWPVPNPPPQKHATYDCGYIPHRSSNNEGIN